MVNEDEEIEVPKSPEPAPAQSAGEKDAKSQKSGGYYSTDVDQLARSKKGVANEERFKRLVSMGEMTHSQIDEVIDRDIKEFMK